MRWTVGLGLLVACSQATNGDTVFDISLAPFVVDTGASMVSPTIVMNELCADNQTLIVDQEGAFEDWIELYNPTQETVDLEGWGLSDDLVVGVWWFESSVPIAPGEHLVIWADDDEGELHADFKLAREGETLWLIDPEGYVADQTTYEEHAPDASWGRRGDGAEVWGALVTATPGTANVAEFAP